MRIEERTCRFDCQGDLLYGVLSLPGELAIPGPEPVRGVLMLVGGAQYRAGSHRQFTLLARDLAADGIPVMRFDYRGMGDSEGEPHDFEHVGDDVRAAIDYFMLALPGLREVAIWGLCDAASAALLYAGTDARVSGLTLVNPWVRTETGMAKTYLRHYYGKRLLTPDFWQKILRGRFDYGAAARSLLQLLRSALLKKPVSQSANGVAAPARPSSMPARATNTTTNAADLPDRMLDGYRRFGGKVLLVLSGNDYTAREFSDLATSSVAWSGLLSETRTQRLDLPDANHTFSTQAWRRQVALRTVQWIRSW